MNVYRVEYSVEVDGEWLDRFTVNVLAADDDGAAEAIKKAEAYARREHAYGFDEADKPEEYKVTGWKLTGVAFVETVDVV